MKMELDKKIAKIEIENYPKFVKIAEQELKKYPYFYISDGADIIHELIEEIPTLLQWDAIQLRQRIKWFILLKNSNERVTISLDKPIGKSEDSPSLGEIINVNQSFKNVNRHAQEYRVCRKCRIEKVIQEFPTHKIPNGLLYTKWQCKVCSVTTYREWKEKFTPEEFKELNRRYERQRSKASKRRSNKRKTKKRNADPIATEKARNRARLWVKNNKEADRVKNKKSKKKLRDTLADYYIKHLIKNNMRKHNISEDITQEMIDEKRLEIQTKRSKENAKLKL